MEVFNVMFYAVSGINGDFDAYERLLKRLGFEQLSEVNEQDIMDEEAVISTLEGEDVLYVLGNIIGEGGGSMKILLDMMRRDNIIAVVGENEYNISKTLSALNEHIRSTGELPPKMLVDKITSMLDDKLTGAVLEFLELSEEDREDVLDYIEEISEEPFLEVMMAKKKFVMVNAGIKNFKPGKELDDYKIENFVTEVANLDKTYYKDRKLVFGHTATGELSGGDNVIIKKNNNIAIDCGCGKGGQLCVYCMNKDTEFYV
jgi:serine/threonine protein phosphatase 1